MTRTRRNNYLYSSDDCSNENLRLRDRKDNDVFSTIFSLMGIEDIIVSSDGLYDGLVLPPGHFMYLWRLAWLSLVSGTYAIIMGHYDLAPVPLGVWLTSINYWWKPDYSWRRYLDMAYVHVSLIYQVYRVIYYENAIAYFITVGLACLAFPIGMYFHKRRPAMSTFCHGLVHLFGNISNFILYSGDIEIVNAVSDVACQQLH